MKKNIFYYHDYKVYLNHYIRGLPQSGRGFRIKMAEFLDCQPGFITKVLDKNSKYDFSLEQADKLNSLLIHNESESKYFLLLIQYMRAGTSNLKRHFMDEMNLVHSQRLKVSKNTESRNVLSQADQLKYYSAWYFAAIRVAVSIPELQTKEQLSNRLGLPVNIISSSLEFLCSRGLVEQRGNRFFHIGQSQLLLSKEDPFIFRNHINWRLKGLNSLENPSSQDLHYSYIVTLSKSDALKIRSRLIETIKEVLEKSGPSSEETIFTLCLDYFEI